MGRVLGSILGAFWEAWDRFWVDFGCLEELFGGLEGSWEETWKSYDFGSVLGIPRRTQAMQDHAEFGGVSPYKKQKQQEKQPTYHK